MSRLAGAIAALAVAPDARASERDEMVRRLDIAPGDSVVELAAWDGYLTGALRDAGACVISIEPEPDMARHFGHRVGALTTIPARAASVDRVACMVGLHHRPRRYRAAAFREARRVLKPGGLFVVCEVQAGTVTAEFLNGTLGKLARHRGDFYERGRLAEDLRRAGFTEVSSDLVTCEWRFTSREQAVRYIGHMFKTRGRNRLLDLGITRYFGESVSLPWPLVFATGRA